MAVQERIIFFDGVCNLCQASVQFVLRHDRKKKFRFASLQRPAAGKMLAGHGLEPDQSHSIVFWEDGKIYTRSKAVMRICKGLGGPWMIFYGLILVPGFIRDRVYNFIARNRYRWFGRKEECWLPDPAIQDRFLDG